MGSNGCQNRHCCTKYEAQVLLNEGKDCWDECEKQTGECKFCGSGSCCRKGYLTSYFSGCSVSNGCQNRHCCTKYEAQGYWLSRGGARLPVRLWFQFNEPKRVVKIRFEEIYGLRDGDVYEVFASEAVGDCGNVKKQIFLAEAEHRVFQTGKEFENLRYFPCYGIQTYHPGGSSWVSLRYVMFGIVGEL